MDLLEISKKYVDRLTETAKIKILLLDSVTTTIVSMVATQSDLLSHEVFLMDRLDSKRGKMRHLTCVVFVRPTRESVQALAREMKDPCYASYEVYFSNVVTKSDLELLAESDLFEMVTRVCEMFMDFHVLSSSLFTRASGTSVRDLDAIRSVCLSTKMKPVIRWGPSGSRETLDLGTARDTASRLVDALRAVPLDFPAREMDPLVLVLDRAFDVVTPLLTPWTYQAMVHEHVGIRNNRVTLDHSSVPADQREMVIGAVDAFFEKTKYLFFDDLGTTVRDYVAEYQKRTTSNKKLETVEDMRVFVANYPEFARFAGSVSKHVTLVSELSRVVEAKRLLEVSDLEQRLATSDTRADGRALEELVPLIHKSDAVRLSLLHGLNGHFELSESLGVGHLAHRLHNIGKPQSGNLISRALSAAENTYTRHKPVLAGLLQQVTRGRLRRQQYPFVTSAGGEDTPASDLLVYIVGGATYEEARVVAEFNAQNKGTRVILGSDRMLRTEDFIKTLNSPEK